MDRRGEIPEQKCEVSHVKCGHLACVMHKMEAIQDTDTVSPCLHLTWVVIVADTGAIRGEIAQYTPLKMNVNVDTNIYRT